MATNPISMFPPAAAPAGVPIDPQSLIADGMTMATAAPAALLAWAQRAQRGEAVIYARAHRLPCGSPLAAVANMLQTGGFIQINHQRSHAMLPWHYVARRTDRAMEVGLAGGRKTARRPSLNPDQATALQILSDCADAGMACPSNSALALQLGISRAHAGAIVARLRDFGLIRIEQAPWPLRVVEIVETGAKTAATA